MKRQGIVAAVAIVALVVAVVLLVVRGGGGGGGAPEETPRADIRFYASDSLGFRIRIPESPDWSLNVDPGSQPATAVVSANHSGGMAIVRVFTRPVRSGETLDDVFEARKSNVAHGFGVQDLDPVIAKVIHDEQRDVGGRRFRQWQAITHASASPEGEKFSLILMWILTIDDKRTLECIGMVRTPVPSTPEQEEVSNGLLRDVAYVLQSFEVR